MEKMQKKTQNKGYYGVQGHSRSSRSVPIESPYATDYLLVINSNWHPISYHFGVYCSLLFKFWTLHFWAAFWGA